MDSPEAEKDKLASTQENVAAAATPERLPALASDPIPDGDEVVEADDNASVADSAFGTDNSDTTSVASKVYAGYMENGRRYQTTREGEYWGPSDEKQFEAMQAAHIVYHILDSRAPNPHFRAPVPKTVQNIIDIGTGNGAWAVEVADRYPSALVQGVDLSPPTDTWVPPNCKFEVDDVLKTWMFNEKFDLIHMRDMHGSFSEKQWTGVYKQAYENLVPGGWIEQAEPGISFHSDDGTLPPGSLLAKWGPLFTECCAALGKPIDWLNNMTSAISSAGFTNITEKTYKVPLGEWAKNPLLKEAGKFQKAQVLQGMEGYAMFVLTHHPVKPWSPEEVKVFLDKVRAEIEEGGFHAYLFKKRVWAQKPLEDKEVKPEVVVEAVVEA